jgi:spore maturation protein CgeB
MNIAFLGHSIVSDWNHGNAHFFRGLIKALHRRGHHVTFFEPRGAWSLAKLQQQQNVSEQEALAAFSDRFPFVTPHFYDETTDWRETLTAFDATLVHEWTDTPLVRDLATCHAICPAPCCTTTRTTGPQPSRTRSGRASCPASTA